MSVYSWPMINPNNDGEHYEALIKRQTKNEKTYDTLRITILFQ